MNELIHKCQVKLAHIHGVNLEDLHYNGYVDCSCIRGEGAMNVQFNLLKEGHIHHKSTVAVNSWTL